MPSHCTISSPRCAYPPLLHDFRHRANLSPPHPQFYPVATPRIRVLGVCYGHQQILRQQGGAIMNRRDFLRCFALTGGLWVLGDGAGRTCAVADQSTSEWPNHPFLQGNFAPVQEEITADNLKIIGTLPPEMDGMFVRNGPNPQFLPLGNYHWFFGDGMLHGVRVHGAKASYRTRYVRTARWQDEHAAGKALYDTFQAPPEKSNRANTALVWHAGR